MKYIRREEDDRPAVSLRSSQLAGEAGDPGGSRTPNPQIRSLMLYPVELRGRSHKGSRI
jgi:hypothetical protein